MCATDHSIRRPGTVVIRWIAPLVLVCLVIAAYRGTPDAGFVVWDDDDHVYENPHITAVDGYWNGWRDWRDTAFYPLTFSTFYAEWRLADGEPWLFHVDNVALHAANAVSVGFLFRALGVLPGVAWGAAGVWALHPMEVASVAWITERKNVLYLFFFVAALLTYARSLDRPPSPSRGLWVVSLILALASHLSKATAVTLPLAVILLHWARGRRFDRVAVLRILPYLAIAVAVGLVHVAREEVEAPLGLGTRLLIGARAFWFYVRTFLWPTDLVAMYPRWSVDDMLWPGLLGWAGIVVAAAIGGWYFGRLPRAVWFGVGHFAASIALVVGVIWFPYMRHSFVADHLAYNASIGLALLTALAAERLLRWLATPPAVQGVFVLAAWLALAGLSKQQTLHWHDTVELWSRALEVNPESTTAHNNLGVALIDIGRREEAQIHFEESLRIDPEDAQAILNLGVLAADRRDWVEAVTYYKKALDQNPTNTFIWNNLGVAAAERGETERAIAFYRQALKYDPDDATTQTNLGAALARQGDYAEAIRHHEEALRLNPRLLKAQYNIAVALADQGRHAEAVPHLEVANALEPGDTEIVTRLATSLSETGDFRGAARLLEEAIERDPADGTLRYQLALVLTELGDHDGAIRQAEAALEVAPERGKAVLHTAIGLMLEGHGRREEAIGHYETAVAMAPDDVDARYTLGVALSAEGRDEDALAQYQRVLALAPDHAEAANNLGVMLFRRGEVEPAIAYFTRARELAPDDADASRNLAMALQRADRVGEAIVVLQDTAARLPEAPGVANLLAWIRATSEAGEWRNAAEAVRFAETACMLTDNTNANYLDTLAAAYAEAGRFADAIRVTREALEMTDDGSQLAGELRQRLALYESGRPYRE